MDAPYVVAECADDSETENLFEWLQDEPELRPLVALQHRKPDDGHLGGAVEIAIAVVSAGGPLAILATSLRTWLQHRGVTVRLQTGDLDVEITADRAKDAEKLIARILDRDSSS